MLPSQIGPYRIVREIGRGGMGVVYEGLHESIERRVALKVLRAEYIRSPQIITRFFNEARAVNRIKHPGIVQISDCGTTTDGMAYLVMEFLEGESLARRLELRGGPLPVPEAMRIARQIAGALAAAHKKGIIHRDLKPDNVMIVPDPDTPGGERAKVLDFGIAKLLEDALGSAPEDQQRTNIEVIMGTPRYMSPEQCKNAGKVEAESDVYALGVVLFQLLSGRTPFTQEARFELMIAHVQQEPPLISEVAPQVPPELSGLVHRMLLKSKEQRPSMAQVVSTLDVMGAQPDDSNSLISRISQPGVEVSGQFSGLGFETSGRFLIPGYEPSGGLAIPAALAGEASSAPSRISQGGALPSRISQGAVALPSRISQSGSAPALIKASPSGGFAQARGPGSGSHPLRPSTPSGSAPVLPQSQAAETQVSDATPSTLGSSVAQSLPVQAAPAALSRRLPWFIGGALITGGLGLYLALSTPPRKPPELPAAVDAGAKAAPATQAPRPVDAAADASRLVHLKIESSPDGAQVSRARDGQVLGVTPWEADLPAGSGWEKLLVELDGYAQREVFLDMSKDSSQRVTLKPGKGKRSSRHHQDSE